MIHCRWLTAGFAFATMTACGQAAAPRADADVVAYLVNVAVRPGYHFSNADDAVSYGRGICGKVANGERYADVINDVSIDIGTTDSYQAAYLITQAVNELCPASIWQLRNSAAGYVLAATS